MYLLLLAFTCFYSLLLAFTHLFRTFTSVHQVWKKWPLFYYVTFHIPISDLYVSIQHRLINNKKWLLPFSLFIFELINLYISLEIHACMYQHIHLHVHVPINKLPFLLFLLLLFSAFTATKSVGLIALLLIDNINSPCNRYIAVEYPLSRLGRLGQDSSRLCNLLNLMTWRKSIAIKIKTWSRKKKRRICFTKKKKRETKQEQPKPNTFIFSS